MQVSENPKSLAAEIRAKLEQYRDQLLDAGMTEPTKRVSSVWHWLFYKPATELTAFVVNLTGTDSHIQVVYGYASTAFTRIAGCENTLIEQGISDAEITLREKITLCDEADETAARMRIAQMYDRFRQIEKDGLLNEVKAKRKAFIQQIAAVLKPMGFKKKANTWTRPLDGEYYVVFNAQKSAFSDEYYFNVYIGKNGSNRYGDCYYTRVAPPGMSPMDWQSVSKDEFEFFLNRTVVPALEQITHTPLSELGKLPHIWSGCTCNRSKCEHCWVEKNLWEAKGIQ